jgi:uncharacterized membrane protein
MTIHTRAAPVEDNVADTADQVTGRLEGTRVLSDVAAALARAADAVVPTGPVRDVARGRWLGHPVHPMLTDLPIGFWTSAFVLDVVPGRRTRPAADALVGLGVLSALPTAAAGLAELTDLDDERTIRVAAAHALGNAVGTALYASSWWARRRGRRGRGFALSLAAAGLMSFAGYLGGHLTYRRAAGVDVAARPVAAFAERAPG